MGESTTHEQVTDRPGIHGQPGRQRVGCARKDWIQQTLVTADVTGMWRSSDGNLELKLEQQGAKVTGSMVFMAGAWSRVPGTINGTVEGDVFSFKQTSGNNVGFAGEMTLAGDEMRETVRSDIGTRPQHQLRRVDSSPPRSH
jgi:hypothetical protein